jgi:phage-related holin
METFLYLLLCRIDRTLKREATEMEIKASLESWLYKNLALIVAAITTLLTPLYPTLWLVGFISIVDFLTGVMGAKSKGEEITSNRMIRKFYSVIAYFLGILIAHVIGGYYGDADFMVKAVVAIIAVTEIQSVRENIKNITGVDILKPLIRILERKQETDA